MKVRNSYLASLERLLLISPNGLERLLQSFKVSRIRDACFTASLFQGFITHNSSPKLGVKECNGMHSECSARRVPTLRK